MGIRHISPNNFEDALRVVYHSIELAKKYLNTSSVTHADFIKVYSREAAASGIEVIDTPDDVNQLRDAITRRFLDIGEATNDVRKAESSEIMGRLVFTAGGYVETLKNDGYDIQALRHVRNIIAHQFLMVDHEVVLNTILNESDDIKTAIENLFNAKGWVL